MKYRIQRAVSLLLALVLTLGLGVDASAAQVSDDLNQTARYIHTTVKAPQVGSVGGEWAVLGLARSGYAVPDSYYTTYYKTVETYVKDKKGVLHSKKYTEYSRVILALTAMGKDARDVAGYDLTLPLGDYDKTIWQGLNGPIWALIALDSGNYPMPQNKSAKTQATRQMYVDCILNRQNPDGGWSLNAGAATSDPDITGMALQALSRYQDQAKVKTAIEKALACMSARQGSDGGFSSWETANSESCVQMIVALCALGLDPEDGRFVKNGKSLLDALDAYRRADGSYCHTKGDGGNGMATEQALYALAAVQRAETGKPSLYDMKDALSLGSGNQAQGLPGKHQDVKPAQVVTPGLTFSDTNRHANQAAIEALAARGIINGMGDGTFGPDKTMTRAQFAAIVVRGLGLPQKAVTVFDDVKSGQWFAPYVGTAYTYGIVNGRSADTFDPNGTITRQEAALMVARAAKLCGMDTEMTPLVVRDVLAQFTDYVTAADWARAGLAFCYQEGILDDSALEIRPKAAIKRCEIAQMLYNLLDVAQLL
ncbi:MAG: S-layer homology domain-containing protein [Ruminiclostridium sp.]|nr:S-layer homology domain-containing protein [Ruminiclostridium sp.]